MKAFKSVLILLFALVSCENKSVTSEELRIGAVLSLTGPAGEQGENIRKGIELAVDEARSQGRKVKFILEDDGTNPARVVSSLNLLIDQHKVDGIIGGVWDFLAASAYPVVHKREIFFVTPTNPFEIIPDIFKTSPYISTIAPTLSSEYEAMKKFLRNVNPKTVLAIYPELPFGISKKDAFEKAAESLKIKNLQSLGFTEDENRGDAMKRASLKLSTLNPDAALVITDYSGLAILAKENKKLGVRTKILTSQHLDQAIIFSNAPDLFTDIYGLYPKIYDQDFVRRFEVKYHEPPKVFASHGYDSVKLLLATPVEKFMGVTGECKKGEILGCKGDTVIMALRNGRLEELK